MSDSTDTTVSDGDQAVSDGGEPKPTDQVNTDIDSSGNGKDPVKYETYQRVLRQHKTDLEKLKRLDELETKEKERSDNKLKADGENEKRIAARDTEISDLKTKLTDRERTLTDGVKLQAFLDKLPGKVKNRAYLQFVDLDTIAMDPETGSIDTATLDQAVNGYVKEHGDLIQRNNTATLPTDAAAPAGGEISYKEWLGLPLKEKRAKMAQVAKSRANH